MSITRSTSLNDDDFRLTSSAMGKGKSGSNNKSGNRTRVNPKTGERETVAGTKAGRGRMKEAPGSPLRTHDIHPPKKAPSVKKPPTD